MIGYLRLTSSDSKKLMKEEDRKGKESEISKCINPFTQRKKKS